MMTKTASPGEVSSVRQLPRPRRPDFFIVGAPKCGTSAMAHYLAAHPDIYMPRKEMHAFGMDLCFGDQFYRRDLNAYLAEFGACQGRRRAGEASVWYLFSSDAAAEIKAFNPDSRIVIMLRDPVEMIYSLYYQFRFDGNEPLPGFEDALAAEQNRRAGRRLGRQTYFAQGLFYRETARYTNQVQRYFDVFGREQVQVIIYDDFHANTGAVYARTLEFLDVAPNPVDIDFKVINGNKYARNSALQAVLNEPLLRSTAIALRPWLPRAVFAGLRNVEARVQRSATRFEKRPPLAPELQARLKREFAPEVERLSELLGRDLTHWST